jgi:hypothetical protein
MKKILAIGLILLSTGCVMRCRVVEPRTAKPILANREMWAESDDHLSAHLFRLSDGKLIASINCTDNHFDGCDAIGLEPGLSVYRTYATMAAAKKAVEAELAKERSR